MRHFFRRGFMLWQVLTARLQRNIRNLGIGLRAGEWLVLIAGATLALLVCQWMLANQRQRIDAQFQEDANRINSHMQQRLDASMNVVIGLQAFSSLNSPITREAFHQYVSALRLETFFPAINNLNYAERVSPEEQPQFWNSLAKRYPDASLSDFHATAALHKKSGFMEKRPIERDAFILSMIEPSAASTVALGKNLAAVPALANAIYLSLRTGKPTSSGRLIQGVHGKKSYIGIAIRLPVYAKGMPIDTEQQREEACIGSIGAGINIDSFLDAGDKDGLSYINYQIFDDALSEKPDQNASSLKNLIFDSTFSRTHISAVWPPSIKIRQAPFMATKALQISGNKSYRVVFTADGPAIEDFSLQYPFYASGGVLLISVLLFFLLRGSRIAAQDAERARISADQANIAKGRFLANMSHEIRTPMNGVLGMLSLLQDSNLSARQAKFAALARDSAESLMTIINEILDISKIEAGKLKLEKIDFDLVRVVESVIANQKHNATIKGLGLESCYEGEPPRMLVGDPTRLGQVLINLVNNAIKFTAYGDVLLRVETRTNPEGHCLLSISVTDTGIGLAAEKIPEIFKEFTQADDSTTREYGGTGLGLSICKSLIEMMGGEIGVESQPGQGSSFWIALVLPYAKDSFPAQPVSAESIPAARSPREFIGSRILVADDNRVNQIFIVYMLQTFGCAVDVAVNGEQAVKMHASTDYDLIFMDCQMPILDGYDATAKIRAAENGAGRTPIVALTAHASLHDKEKCLAAGMDDFVPKPVQKQLLRDTLARWLKRGSITSAVAETASSLTANDFVEIRESIGVAFDDAALVFMNDFAPQKIAELREAISKNEPSSVSPILHSLIGSASMLGANTLAELCRNMSRESKIAGLSGLTLQMIDVESEYSSVEVRLRGLIGKSRN
jgi:signal transduction histidine kinase/AmiR/NasT family two-component response regulator